MKNKPIILLSICLAFLLVSSQAFGKKPGMPSEEEVPETETPYGGEYGKKESKPKSPDLEIPRKTQEFQYIPFPKNITVANIKLMPRSRISAIKLPPPPHCM